MKDIDIIYNEIKLIDRFYQPLVVNGELLYDGIRELKNQNIRLDCIDVNNKTVIDFGCNTGYIIFELLKRGASYCFGVDVANYNINICNAIKRIEKLKNIDFYCDYFYDVDEPNRLTFNPKQHFDIGLLLSIEGIHGTILQLEKMITFADVWYVEPNNHKNLSKKKIFNWGMDELTQFGKVEFLTYTDYQNRGLFKIIT
jgi:SAM-dependent methyltransferase